MSSIDDLPVSDATKQLLRDTERWQADNGDGALVVYGEGLCYASVCTSLDDAAADARMAARPAGTRHGWQRSADTHFADGQSNPCPCEREPDSRRHILYEA